MKSRLFFLTILVLIFLPFTAKAENKVALLIGNGNYQLTKDYDTLATAKKDVEAMMDKLQKLGFVCEPYFDCTYSDIINALSEFEKIAKDADVAVFYFSGHGQSKGGVDYILPIKNGKYFNPEMEWISIDTIANIFNKDKGGYNCHLSFFFLDCCRDSANDGSLQTKGSKKPKDQEDSLLKYYATQDQKTANSKGNDGSELSPFTQALVEHLDDEGSFCDIFEKCIIERVKDLTYGKQIPTSDGNVNSYSFKPGKIPEKIVLNKSALDLEQGTFDVLKITSIYPQDIDNYSIIWTSNDPNIAIVSETGVVSALNEGVTTIKATCSKGTASAICKISVSKQYKTYYVPDTNKSSYQIGDLYDDGVKKGIVFSIDSTGTSGKIISLHSAIISWTSKKKEDNRLVGANSETDGLYNMKVIMEQPGWRVDYPAFGYCYGLGNDWYLPSYRELEDIYNNKDILLESLEKYHGDTNLLDTHTSSTEFNKDKVRTLMTQFSGANYEDSEYGWMIRFTTFSKQNVDSSIRPISTFGKNYEPFCLHKRKLFIENHCTEQMNATFEHTLIDSDKITWSSSNESIVSISQVGLLNTFSAGTATIRAHYENYADSCIVEVLNSHKGHNYVDLGLPSGTLWADKNINALKSEDIGDLFSYGGTKDYEENSLMYNKTEKQLRKNNMIDIYGGLSPELDAATVNWGGDWSTPDIMDYYELISLCDFEIVDFLISQGVKVTGPNGNSIIFPITGLRMGIKESGESIITAINYGEYATSTLSHPKLHKKNHSIIVGMDYDTNKIQLYNSSIIGNFRMVRAVIHKN